MQTDYNREKKGRHLTLVERCIIKAWLKLKDSERDRGICKNNTENIYLIGKSMKEEKRAYYKAS